MERERLEALIAEGLSQRKIAQRCGCSQATVRHWLLRYGLRTVPSGLGAHEVEGQMRGRCARHGEVDLVPRPEGGWRCKRCRMDSVAGWRRRVKQRLVARAGGACTVCGYSRCVGALQFHHLDRSQKRFAIAARGLARSWEVLCLEADKCVLLCANCHVEVEAGVTTIPAEIQRSPVV